MKVITDSGIEYDLEILGRPVDFLNLHKKLENLGLFKSPQLDI